MSPPRSYVPARRLRRLAVLSLAACALLAGALGASPASGQDGFTPDAQVVADVRGYAAETHNGHAHVLRWMRVLHTLDALNDVTSTEARGFADTYWSVRWDPVVAEIEKLEQGASAADSQVVADVRDYSQETNNGADHVLRWYRVLHTFGALTAMTAAEAQGHADTFSSSRWDPVVEELKALETSQAAAAGDGNGGPVGDGGPSGNSDGNRGALSDGGPSGNSDGGASGDSDGGVSGDQATCIAPVLTAEVVDTYTVQGDWTVAADNCDAGGVYVELKKSADTDWISSGRVSAYDDGRKFIHGALGAVSYDFRVRAIDNNGVTRTSNVGTLTPVAGTAGVKVLTNLAGESFVYWSKIADTTGITGYTIRYREARTFDVKTHEVPAEVCTTDFGTALADCAADSVDTVKAYKLGGVLDAAKTYWLEVGTKTTSGTETVTRFSPVVRAPAADVDAPAADAEPYMVWFIDNTPSPNFLVNRVFMFVDTNHPNSSAICHIDGASINCPPRTLVSLAINQGGAYRVWANATLGTGDVITSANGTLSTGDLGDPIGDSNHPQHSFDAGTINTAWASGGDDTIGIAWNDALPGRPNRKVTSYVVKYQRTGGTAVWVPVDMVTIDHDNNSGTDEVEVDHYTLEISGLAAGEYTVIAYPCANAASATEVKKCTSGNQPSDGRHLGARARLSRVTVGPEKAGLPGAPTGVSATAAAGRVNVKWTHPRTAPDAPAVHYHRVRLTPTSGDVVYGNVVTQIPYQIRSQENSGRVRGVAAGTYAVAIQSRNANGGSEWVDAGTVTVT